MYMGIYTGIFGDSKPQINYLVPDFWMCDAFHFNVNTQYIQQANVKRNIDAIIQMY